MPMFLNLEESSDWMFKKSEKRTMDAFVLSHVVQSDYEFLINRRLVTLFTAPHYCGKFDNAAAVMKINKDLLCLFKVGANYFLAHPKALRSLLGFIRVFYETLNF
ncbi:unnamed protein product [Angiostrongylus costaricensis]|uniref:Uncharacterized protein n=1 Tax=Angiostrongylus costaricensis TaxID=334426 RepID=A0A0R3PIE5_ANGCS|nr:unnamed protein product [Angiostrongylus costaricensis]